MKVVFFVNIIRQARCIRRIEDFIRRGYEVEVFGFDRVGDNRALPKFKHSIIGIIDGADSYFYRLKMMRQAISRVCSEYRSDSNVAFYLFNLDIALSFMLTCGRRKQYMYEVSDLMELEVANKFLSRALIIANRHIIDRSLETIMTSAGFIDFFYRSNVPNHISLVQNKLSTKIIELPEPEIRTFDINNLTIGFTGAIRNKCIYNFIETIGAHFPSVKLVFYGIFTDDKIYSNKIKETISKYDNISYLGPFKNPYDFPKIYSQIDLVLSLYSNSGNDGVLEPNKLYEAIFYRKPIIVSKNTFIGKFVEKSNIGYTINGENPESIIEFIKNISEKDYNEKVNGCASIPKEYCIDNTTALFDKLAPKLLHNKVL